MFANVVPLMCVYLLFALSKASRARGVWLLVSPSLLIHCLISVETFTKDF